MEFMWLEKNAEIFSPTVVGFGTVGDYSATVD